METVQAAGVAGRRTGLAAGLAALAVLGCAAMVAFDIMARQNVVSNSGQDFITALALAGLGFLVVRRHPANPIGWLLLAAADGLAITSAAGTWTALAYRQTGYRLPFGPAALLLGYSWLLPLGALAVAILLFPDGRLPSPRWRWALAAGTLACAGYLGCAYGVVLSLVAGHRVHLDASGSVAALDDPSGRTAWLGTVDALLLPVIAVCLLSFATAQVLAWRRASGERRQQLKWLLAGALGFLFGGIVVLPISSFDPNPSASVKALLSVLSVLSLISLPACMAVAILRYRLYDVDRIISRTLAYAIVTGLLIGVYAGLVLLATQVLGVTSPVAVAVATLAAAALFAPVRRRVQDLVDRRFNRTRYDADRTIAVFAARLKEAVDLDAVRGDLVGTVQHALEPEHVSLWIRR